MALVVKPISTTTPQSVASVRAANLARTGPTSNLGGAVDSIAPPGGTLIENGLFSAVTSQGNQDFSGQLPFSSRQGHGEAPPDPRTGIINITSQGFVDILELRDTVTAAGAGGGGAGEEGIRSGRLIGHVVALYETSIEIAAGSLNVRGETVSIVL